MIDTSRRIETPRLVLRRHRPEDVEAFTSFLADADATQFMAFTDDQKTPAGARAMIEYVIEAYDSDTPVISLTIADPVTDIYLGSCGCAPLEGTHEAEIFFTVLSRFGRRGYATEAAGALIERLWRTTGVERVVGFVVPENVASVSVLEKCGFQDAGPVDRAAAAGELAHRRMTGRRYVKARPANVDDA